MSTEKTLAAYAFAALAGFWTFGAGALLAQTTTTVPSEVRVSEPVTVTVWNRPLVVLRASIGDITPQMRAERILAKVEGLPLQSPNPNIRADRARVGSLEGILVTVDENIVLGIVPQDLDPESQE
ncbi:MAG TPA: hypothetical protein VGC53_13145, partial [Vicinamibacteria bacterium]